MFIFQIKAEFLISNKLDVVIFVWCVAMVKFLKLWWTSMGEFVWVLLLLTLGLISALNGWTAPGEATRLLWVSVSSHKSGIKYLLYSLWEWSESKRVCVGFVTEADIEEY